MYKILLPKGLLSSKEDVKAFLEERNLNIENYQIGITKVRVGNTYKCIVIQLLFSRQLNFAF